MTFVCECHHCGKQYRVPEDSAGKNLVCRRCFTVVRISKVLTRVPTQRPSRDPAPLLEEILEETIIYNAEDTDTLGGEPKTPEN